MTGPSRAIRTILVGIDGSAHANAALVWAIDQEDSEIVLRFYALTGTPLSRSGSPFPDSRASPGL